MSCYKCNKNTQPTTSLITECQSWHATVLFKNNNNNGDLKLTFFNTAITEINSFKKETTKLTEDDITTNFLTLPSTVTFNST